MMQFLFLIKFINDTVVAFQKKKEKSCNFSFTTDLIKKNLNFKMKTKI